MTGEKKPDKSDRLIEEVNKTQNQLEAALRELEAYANALCDQVTDLRKRHKDE